jgi:hypothetical protein
MFDSFFSISINFLLNFTVSPGRNEFEFEFPIFFFLSNYYKLKKKKKGKIIFNYKLLKKKKK